MLQVHGRVKVVSFLISLVTQPQLNLLTGILFCVKYEVHRNTGEVKEKKKSKGMKEHSRDGDKRKKHVCYHVHSEVKGLLCLFVTL